MISLYAQKENSPLWYLEPEVVEQSKDTIQIMEQFIEFKASLKNKLDALDSKKATEGLIKFIEDQIDSTTNTINELQNKIDELVKNYDSEMLTNMKSMYWRAYSWIINYYDRRA